MKFLDALVLHRQLDEGERIYDQPEGGSDEEDDDPYRWGKDSIEWRSIHVSALAQLHYQVLCRVTVVCGYWLVPYTRVCWYRPYATLTVKQMINATSGYKPLLVWRVKGVQWAIDTAIIHFVTQQLMYMHVRKLARSSERHIAHSRCSLSSYTSWLSLTSFFSAVTPKHSATRCLSSVRLWRAHASM